MFVFIRNDTTQPPLSPLYHGPYHVLERGPETVRLKIGEKEDEVSADRLKAECYEEEPTQAVPPRRGRPRKMVTTSQSLTRTPRGCHKKIHQSIPTDAQPKRPRGRPRLIHQIGHRFLHLGGEVSKDN